MPGGLPTRLDVSRLARRAARIDGRFAVSECKRLVASLHDDTGTVTARISLHNDEAGHRVIEGTASADVQLLCQRCLEPFATGLHAEFRLAQVADDARAAALPDGLEPVICPDGMLDTRAMIEDELILVLPVVARHDDEDVACST